MAKRLTLDEKIERLKIKEAEKQKKVEEKKALKIAEKKESTLDALPSIIAIGDKSLTTLFINACIRRGFITTNDVIKFDGEGVEHED